MRFSLICATLKRTAELDEMINSLCNQTFKDFELIIVDQNKDNRLIPIIDKYSSKIIIKHIKSEVLGASYNRNIGIKEASGQIIGFPDDDCLYTIETLAKINNFFLKNEEFYFYACNTKDFEGKHKRYKTNNVRINKFNFYRRGIEFSVFIRTDKNKFYFDDDFGIGQKYGNCEISEMILNMLHKGYKGMFFGKEFIYHPFKNQTYNLELTQKYGEGFGAMYKKAITVYKFYPLLIQFIYYLLKNIVAIIITNKKAYYKASLKGKIIGYKSYNKGVRA